MQPSHVAPKEEIHSKNFSSKSLSDIPTAVALRRSLRRARHGNNESRASVVVKTAVSPHREEVSSRLRVWGWHAVCRRRCYLSAMPPARQRTAIQTVSLSWPSRSSRDCEWPGGVAVISSNGWHAVGASGRTTTTPGVREQKEATRPRCCPLAMTMTTESIIVDGSRRVSAQGPTPLPPL